MLGRSIYLLFINNLKSFYSAEYLIYFLKSALLLTCTYSVPLFILDKVTKLSDNNTCNSISKYIFIIFYYLPAYLVILIIHNSRLIKLLEKRYTIFNCPAHIYITLLYAFIYITLSIIGYMFNFKYNNYIIFLLDTISYGLFFNETAYIFINNAICKYRNKIDFYNNNFLLFNIYGFILNLILNNVSFILFMPISFCVTSILQNALISNDYSVYNNNSIKYNFLYPFEKVFNLFVKFISTFIFFSLHKRRMIYGS